MILDDDDDESIHGAFVDDDTDDDDSSAIAILTKTDETPTTEVDLQVEGGGLSGVVAPVVVSEQHNDNDVVLPEVLWSDIDIESPLGKGSFTIVSKVRVLGDVHHQQNDYPIIHSTSSTVVTTSPPSPLPSTRYYALKQPQTETSLLSKESLQDVYNELAWEANLLQQFHHENIIQLYGIVSADEDDEKEKGDDRQQHPQSQPPPKRYYLLLELFNETLDEKLQQWRRSTLVNVVLGGGGRLRKKEKNKTKRKNRFSIMSQNAIYERIETIAIEIANAMTYIHEQKIIYRDLKPENIGFTRTGQVKLFNFGLARSISSQLQQQQQQEDEMIIAGTSHYMAPEIRLVGKEGIDTPSLPPQLASDVYSFGLILFELCTLQLPYQKRHYYYRNYYRRFFTGCVSKNDNNGTNSSDDDDDDDDGSNHDSHQQEQQQLYQEKKFSWRPSLEKVPSIELQELISDCWSFHPKSRPEFSTIVQILQKEVSSPSFPKTSPKKTVPFFSASLIVDEEQQQQENYSPLSSQQQQWPRQQGGRNGDGSSKGVIDRSHRISQQQQQRSRRQHRRPRSNQVGFSGLELLAAPTLFV